MAGCCDVPVGATPRAVHNRPALEAVAYRIGTFDEFRHTMLRAISEHVRRDRRGRPPTRPLEGWTARTPDDPGIAVVEMWAYLADILTFYQERIANEAYLRTATQPTSVAALVKLIGYQPAPGRAATADLAFTTDRDATVRLDAGLLVQSVPGQDERPQKFETVEEVVAHASLEVLRPRASEVQRLPRGSRRAVLVGIGLGIGPGDWVAIVGEERRSDPGSERWDVRRVATVDEDPAAGTTTLGWDEGLGALARPWRAAIDPAANPEVWVFRASASLFGYNAPDYRLLDPAVAERISPDDWNTARLPEDEDHPERIYLDAVHPGVEPDGWIALVTAGDALLAPDEAGVAAGRHEPYVELYPVLEVAEASRLGYTLSATVTRVTVDTTVRDGIREPENIRRFPLRTTTVLIRSERLELAEVPISQPLAGDVIELVGHHPDLHRRRRLVVTGELAGGTETATAVETVEIAQVTHEGPPGAAHTTITLANPLVNAYDPASVLIFGNVARASHGETVADEVLGDGDAAQEFQTFELRKGPLTYVGQPGAPGGVASTVELRVDDVRWEEVTDLHGLASDRRAYVVRRRPDATALMGFGDGRTAARLVSGRGNVTATYRVGLGPEGNVSAGALRTLLRKPLGLRGATNLAPAFGGTAAEPPAAVKATAPGTVRTFGRIVSLGDAEDAAREFIGIAKARATRAWDGERQVVDLVVAADGGGPTAPLLPDLQADLDARRDRHQSLRLREVRRLPIRVGLAVAIDRAHEVETVRAAAEAALRALLAFDALDIGQSVHLSDIHRAVQAVPGVVAVDVDELRFARPEDRLRRGGEAVAQPRLLVGPDEIASVEELDALRVTASFVKDAGT